MGPTRPTSDRYYYVTVTKNYFYFEIFLFNTLFIRKYTAFIKPQVQRNITYILSVPITTNIILYTLIR